MQPGDLFENQAEIFFDYNFPIVTNTTQTRVDISIGDISNIDHDKFVVVFPNPVSSQLNIKSNEFIQWIIVRNLMGQIMEKYTINNLKNSIDLDVNQLPQGTYLIEVKTLNKSHVRKFNKL